MKEWVIIWTSMHKQKGNSSNALVIIRLDVITYDYGVLSYFMV